MECYVDYITIKSHSRSNHLHDLRTVFDIMRAYQLKINHSWECQAVNS